jgi:hypothetical protein
MRVHSWVVCLFVIVLAGLLYGQGGANGTPSPRDRVLDPGPPPHMVNSQRIRLLTPGEHENSPLHYNPSIP